MKALNALILASLISCATMSPVAPTGYEITKIENKEKPTMSGYGSVKVTYQARDTYAAGTEERIKNEMLAEKEASELRSMIPKGGMFYIEIFRRTAESASLNMFTYIYFKNGKEIYREEANKGKLPGNIVAKTPHSKGEYNYHWWNEDIAYVPFEFNEDDIVQFFVVDKTGGRDEFTLKKLNKEQADKQIEDQKKAAKSSMQKKKF